MGKYICQRPIHPGELLKEETEERKLSQRRLAEHIRLRLDRPPVVDDALLRIEVGLDGFAEVRGPGHPPDAIGARR